MINIENWMNPWHLIAQVKTIRVFSNALDHSVASTLLWSELSTRNIFRLVARLHTAAELDMNEIADIELRQAVRLVVVGLHAC